MKITLLLSIILLLILTIGLLGLGAYVAFAIGKVYGIIYAASLTIGISIGTFIVNVTSK